MQPNKVRSNRSKGEGSIYQHTDGRWMYSIMHAGKRLTKSLKTRDYDEALRNYQRVRNQFMGRIDRGELEPSSVKTLTIGELVIGYIKHVQDNGRKSEYVIRKVLGKLQQGREFIPTRKVATLTTPDFKAYRDREVGAGVAHATINYRFALLRAAMNLEMKQTPSRVGKVPYIPIIQVDNRREGFLEYDDRQALLDSLPQSLKALFVIAFHSGCRLGEVLNMKWSDVDWKNRVIRLPRTKNGDKRNLPWWGGIEEHLRAQKAYRDKHHPKCEYLFFWMSEDVQLDHGGVRNVPGTPIRDFRKSWDSAVEVANEANPNVSINLLFHDLRRSGVRVMVQEAEIPESQAMLISGHKTRAMLERYNIVSLKNVQDAGAKLDAWSRTRKAPASEPAPAEVPAARAVR
jgi:integrase